MKLTEAKLKQLIKEVLNESANSPADLPEGVYVSVEKHPSHRSFIIRYVNEEGRSTSKEFGFKGILVIGEPQLSDDYPCENAFAIEWASATPGYGPLLYDVAMEVATLEGAGLVSDRTVVKPAALRVWDFYMNNRDDVAFKQLDNEEGELTPKNKKDDCSQNSSYKHAKDRGEEWTDSPLSKFYTKEPTTLRALGVKLRVDGTNLTF
mgnify:FL=1